MSPGSETPPPTNSWSIVWQDIRGRYGPSPRRGGDGTNYTSCYCSGLWYVHRESRSLSTSRDDKCLGCLEVKGEGSESEGNCHLRYSFGQCRYRESTGEEVEVLCRGLYRGVARGRKSLVWVFLSQNVRWNWKE